jgi:transcriptional regulator with XRE-family HTH domain
MLANLKTTIAARRLTQVDLAVDLKIAPTVLSEIIHGRRQADPSLRARLAEILQANEDWLFARTFHIPPKSDATETPAIA